MTLPGPPGTGLFDNRSEYDAAIEFCQRGRLAIGIL